MAATPSCTASSNRAARKCARADSCFARATYVRIPRREVQLSDRIIVETALHIQTPEFEARSRVVRFLFQVLLVALDQFLVFEPDEHRGFDINLGRVTEEGRQPFRTHDGVNRHHAQQGFGRDAGRGKRQFERQRQRARVFEIQITESAAGGIQHIAGHLPERNAFGKRNPADPHHLIGEVGERRIEILRDRAPAACGGTGAASGARRRASSPVRIVLAPASKAVRPNSTMPAGILRNSAKRELIMFAPC